METNTFKKFCKIHSLKGNPKDGSKLSRRYDNLKYLIKDDKSNDKIGILNLTSEIQRMEDDTPVKILAFDHGGVLEGQMIANELITPNDFVLTEFDWGCSLILKDGVQITKCLNLLVKREYLIAYHSANVFDDQMALHTKLIKACNEKGLTWPVISCMPVLTNTSSKSNILNQNHESIKQVVYFDDNESDKGKSRIRNILENILTIKDKSKCVIFDDGMSNIEAAYHEGYDVALCATESTNPNIKPTTILEKLEEISKRT